MRKKIIVLFAALFLAGNCCGCQERRENRAQLEETEPEETENELEQENEEEKKTIFVYVCGAVCKAGVYELAQDGRVYEAIEKAGGFAEGAAVNQVNQAALLQDEEQLYVPTVEEAAVQSDAGGRGEAQDGRINLNTAAKEELMTLRGIGEAKAESIIRYREEHGRFQSVEDIKQIEGIKDGVFEKIRDFITV